MVERTCSFPGCGKSTTGAGLCSAHYKQHRLGRELTPIRRGVTVEERFWEKVDKTLGGCWAWVGALSAWGYGNFGINSVTYRAHRLSYEWLVGPIPDGLVLDHLCRNRACVNPDHLEAVTPRTNILRGVGPALARMQNVDKMYCKHGHPLFGDNLYMHPTKGYRYCRECARRSGRAYRARRAAAKDSNS